MQKFIFGVSALFLFALAGTSFAADTYPSRPVRMMVPFAPGGASDFVARVLQPKLTEVLGQQIVVDNRAGASGNIGVELAAHAVPDGYTFLLGNVGTMAINPQIFPKFSIKPVTDFICVTTVVDVAGALAVHPTVPVSTLKEFIDYAKARPGKLNYGSSGAGAAQSLMMEYLKLKSGIDVMQINYKGGAGAATAALLAGEVSTSMVSVASFVPFRKSGKVKVLAVVSNKRPAAMADVPTFAELGFPELKTGSWQGIYLPLRTPRPIVNKMSESVIKVLHDPWVIERLAAGGADIIESKSTEDCSNFMKVQNQFFGDLVKRVGVTAE